MDRWVPVGRDLEQILSLYSYALAYIHKALSFLFPKLTLYQTTLYVPVFCFCIGIAAICLFLYHTYGLLFASTFGILIATLPSTINRSSAGFCDRDSWCLMLGILVIVTYLASLQTQHHRRRLIFTLASGVYSVSWRTLLGRFRCFPLYSSLCRTMEISLFRNRRGFKILLPLGNIPSCLSCLLPLLFIDGVNGLLNTSLHLC